MINTKFPYGEEYTQTPTDESNQIAKEMVSEEWVFNNLLRVLWLETYSNSSDSAIYYVKTVSDYFLWILGFISLIILLLGFYKILFTSDKFSDSFNQWKKYLKAWIIWIIWIGLSWLIVSFLFYFVERWL